MVAPALARDKSSYCIPRRTYGRAGCCAASSRYRCCWRGAPLGFFAALSTRPSRRGGQPSWYKRCTRASKFLRFYLFCDARVHLLLRCAFAAMYLCCGAPFTARSPCSRVPWLPLQPIQSCPRAAFGYNAWCFVPLAQWIRASASGAEGRRFESCKGHQIGQPGLLHAARVFSLREPGPLTAVRDNRVSEDFRRGDAMVVPDAVFVRALHGAYNGTLVLKAYCARVWARCMC